MYFYKLFKNILIVAKDHCNVKRKKVDSNPWLVKMVFEELVNSCRSNLSYRSASKYKSSLFSIIIDKIISCYAMYSFLHRQALYLSNISLIAFAWYKDIDKHNGHLCQYEHMSWNARTLSQGIHMTESNAT